MQHPAHTQVYVQLLDTIVSVACLKMETDGHDPGIVIIPRAAAA